MPFWPLNVSLPFEAKRKQTRLLGSSEIKHAVGQVLEVTKTVPEKFGCTFFPPLFYTFLYYKSTPIARWITIRLEHADCDMHYIWDDLWTAFNYFRISKLHHPKKRKYTLKCYASRAAQLHNTEWELWEITIILRSKKVCFYNSNMKIKN